MDITVLSQEIHHYSQKDRSTIFASRVATDRHEGEFEVLTRVGMSGYAEIVVATVPLSNEEQWEISDAVIERERDDVFAGVNFLREHEAGR